MNKYRELRRRQQKEFDAFPIGAAFSDKQFEEMMAKWGYTVDDTDKIYSEGYGCYIRREDAEAYHSMGDRFAKEMQDAIDADETGEGFIYDMFLEELADHEYCITYDLSETLSAIGMTADEINASKKLLHGLNKAVDDYLEAVDEY